MKKNLLVTIIALVLYMSLTPVYAADYLTHIIYADEITAFQESQDAFVLVQLVEKQEDLFHAVVLKVLNGHMASDTVLIKNNFSYNFSNAAPSRNDFCALSLKKKDNAYEMAWGAFKADRGDYRTLQLEPVESNVDLACLQWYINTDGKEKVFSFEHNAAYVRRHPSNTLIQIYPKTKAAENMLATLNTQNESHIDLFLMAGFPQTGHYIAVLSLLLLVYMGLYRVHMFPKKTGFKFYSLAKGHLKACLWIPFILLFLYHIFSNMLNLPQLFGDVVNRFLFKNNATSYLGSVFCMLSLVIFYTTLLSFGNNFRNQTGSKKAYQLVTTGIFAKSRNPIYVAWVLELMGIFLILPTFLSLAYLLAGILLIHRQILMEEDSLKEYYGKNYENYCHTVKRYL